MPRVRISSILVSSSIQSAMLNNNAALLGPSTSGRNKDDVPVSTTRASLALCLPSSNFEGNEPRAVAMSE